VAGWPSSETSGFATFTAPADVVRRQYLASAHGDLDALRATLADDVEWTEMAGLPAARDTYRTPDGVTANVMEQLGKEWDNWIAHDDTYVIDGENVVVLARYTATNKATVARLGTSGENGGLGAYRHVPVKPDPGHPLPHLARFGRHPLHGFPGAPVMEHPHRVEKRPIAVRALG